MVCHKALLPARAIAHDKSAVAVRARVVREVREVHINDGEPLA